MKNASLSRGAVGAFVSQFRPDSIAHNLRQSSRSTKTISYASIVRSASPLALCGLGIAALSGCGGGSGGISPFPTTTPIPTTMATASPTTTATANPTTGPTTKPTTKPTTGPTTKPTTNPTTGPTTQPTTRPTVTPTTKPTVAPTVRPTNKPTPTATPSNTNGPVTVFFSSGNVNGGQYVQTFGQFLRFKLVPLGPTPTPEPTTGPNPTPLPTTVYLGTYKLSNQETGTFALIDQTDPDDFDSASGTPNIPENKTFDSTPIAQGTATITGKVSGSSGSGSIKLSDGITGTFTITSRVVTSNFLKKLRSMNPLVK